MGKITLKMISTFLGSFEGNLFLILFLAGLVFLLVFGKGKRKTLAFPTLFILLLVFNPLMYKYVWTKLLRYAYWRTIWLIPVITVIAVATIRLAVRFKKLPLRILVVALIMGIAAGTGTYVYIDKFSTVNNLYKLPDPVIHVCDILLDQEEVPYALVDDTLTCYIRQYTTRIHLLYGRDAWGYIDNISDEADLVHLQMVSEDPNYIWIAGQMRSMGYKYLVILSDESVDEMEDIGYTYIAETDGYQIYCLSNGG